MFLPELIDPGASRDQISTFLGMNHQLENNAGEWYDELNLSTDHYPVMSVRKKRGIKGFEISNPLNMPDRITAAAFNNYWVFVWKKNMYAEVNGACIKLAEKISDTSRLVTMGAYVICFPEGIYVNTASYNGTEFTDKGNIYASFQGSSVYYWRCDAYGHPIDDIISSTAPVSPVNGQRWYDSENNVLSIYSEAQEQWVQQRAEYYFALGCSGIAEAFIEGDSVDISSDATGTIAEAQKRYEHLFSGNRYIYSVHHGTGEPLSEEQAEILPFDTDIDYVVITTDKYLDKTKLKDSPQDIRGLRLKFERKFPKLDYVFECNNRLWGCYFGKGDDGKILNEIYASKLGDFKNWYSMQGTAMDSWNAPSGIQGAWTGAISYGGYPTFFKEGAIYRVFGSFPAQYSFSIDSIEGVALGNGRSLAVVGDTLFYQGRRGIYAYNGSQPQLVSKSLGDMGKAMGFDETISALRTAGDNGTADLMESVRQDFIAGTKGINEIDGLFSSVAGSNGNKLYIDKFSGDDKLISRFVFDTENSIWHREQTALPLPCGTADCRSVGYVYGSGFQTHPTLNAYVTTAETEAEDNVTEWYAETTALGTTDPDRKYVSRIDLRMQLEVGARVMIFIQYDSAGDWHHIATMTGTNLRAFSLPVRLKRCDHFRLRLNGTGDVKIYSITKTIESGSDL